MPEWRFRWGYWIATTPSAPGVWRMRDGGYLVVVKARAGKGKPRATKQRAMHDATLPQAKAEAERLRESARLKAKGLPMQPQTPFAKFAAQLFAQKCEAGELNSAKTVERWETTLEKHLVPAFGRFYCEEITFAHLDRWRDRLALDVEAEKYSPRTVNGWISILKVISKKMSAKLDKRDPADALSYLSTKKHRTYTPDEPNALTEKQTAAFLEYARVMYPQHYAFIYLGFATGLRPSEIRGIRRTDVDWKTGELRIQQTHSLGQQAMEGTKTGLERRLWLPPAVMGVLREHLDSLTRPKMKASELLFPARHGGFRARSALDRPFADICARLKISPAVTPYAMRRTNKDLMRAAGQGDVVSKAISGHATDEMHEHYSTASPEEIRGAIGKITSLLRVGERAGKRAGRNQR